MRILPKILYTIDTFERRVRPLEKFTKEGGFKP